MNKIFTNTIRLLTQEEKKQFFLLTLTDAVICILDIFSLAALVYLINFYLHPEGAYQGQFDALLKDYPAVLPVGIFFLFYSIKNFAAYQLTKQQYKFVYRVASRISEKKLFAFLEGPYQQYQTDTAVLIKSISQQPVEFAHYVLAGLQQIITQSILIGCTVLAIVFFNASLFLLLLLILLPPVVLLSFLIKKTTRNFRGQTKTNSEKALQYLKEGLAGFIESKIFKRSDFFTSRYSDRQQQLNNSLSNLQAVQAVPGRLMEVFTVAGLFVLIAISSFWGPSVISLITVGAFMAAAYKIIPGVVKILNSTGTIRAYEYTIAGINNTEAAPTSPQSAVENINTIACKNISFTFGDQAILSNFNCYLQQGDFIGINGISGRGKTTLIHLLLGFEQCKSGQILFNDIALDAGNVAAYWPQIAYVKQQTFLIHDTVLANITLSNSGVDNERLEYAVAASGLTEMIAQYPEGLEKIITENGKNISGGQRQRIAIARALYKKAGLLILDEPFNELDNNSENKLLLHLQELSKAGTIIILVTHNTKSLLFCNKIISLDGQ